MTSKRAIVTTVLAGIGVFAAVLVRPMAAAHAEPAGPTAAAHARSTVVRTDPGPLRGVVHDGYRTFEGVPYAAPPTGRLRFGSPRPAVPWSGVRDADHIGPACAQHGGFPGDARSESEDCLYLNVTTPVSRHPGRKPVMVWIHGDGFFQSSGDRNAPWFRAAETPAYPTGAYHAGELQYLFTRAYGAGTLNAAQQHLSNQMISYWTTFAHRQPERRQHAVVGAVRRHVQSLAPHAVRPVDLAAEHDCGFWQSIS